MQFTSAMFFVFGTSAAAAAAAATTSASISIRGKSASAATTSVNDQSSQTDAHSNLRMEFTRKLDVNDTVNEDDVIIAESVCGKKDDRVPNKDPRVGRFKNDAEDRFCTAWLISATAFVTSGSCVTSEATEYWVDFNMYSEEGEENGSEDEDQYNVDQTNYPKLVSGKKWVVGSLFANGGEVNKGCWFNLEFDSDPSIGSSIRITGHRSDKNKRIQQTDKGDLSLVGDVLRYDADTSSGNEGGPIINESTGGSIGMHIGGDCELGLNGGISINRPEFKAAILKYLNVEKQVPSESCGKDVVFLGKPPKITKAERPEKAHRLEKTKPPTRRPTNKPVDGTNFPTYQTNFPTYQPTNKPTKRPKNKPTNKPTPTRRPDAGVRPVPPTNPTNKPTRRPDAGIKPEPPTNPTNKPTRRPDAGIKPEPPTNPTNKPTRRPDAGIKPEPPTNPTNKPTRRPDANERPESSEVSLSSGKSENVYLGYLEDDSTSYKNHVEDDSMSYNLFH